jgi:branched-chain amino acid aminotransferase
MILGAWRWRSGENKLDRLRFEATMTSNQIAKILPEGVYTTIRTYCGDQVLRWDQHIQRLRESAELMKRGFTIDDIGFRQIMRIAINEIEINGNIKIRLQVDLSQGLAPIFYILMEPLVVPSEEDRRAGVVTITRRMHRENPLAKGTGFIHPAEQIRSEIAMDINEVLMVGQEGELLEGLSSNFFAVQHGTVWTSNEGVLRGITRGVVLEAVKRTGIPVNLTHFSVDHIAEMEEAFITSTSRGVLAIRRIDEINMPAPVPGCITQKIEDAYQEQIIQEVEPI